MRAAPLIVVLSLSLGGCAGARAYSQARKADTPAAYGRFIADWPDHPRASAAERRQEELDWGYAQATDASDAYLGYLGAHPSGPHATEARERADRLAWTEARAAATVEALTAYVARYPSSEHLAEANALIEQAWVDGARTDDTEQAWSRYLVRYPQGQFVAEARGRVAELAWLRTVETDTRDSYQRYRERFPDSPHDPEAETWLAATRVSELQPVVRLVDTWQDDGMRSTILQRVRTQLERGLLYDLKRDFTIRRTLVDDPGADAEALPHPQEQWGVEPGVGLLVLEYTEARGRKFDPKGHATDITAELVLYVPATSTPAWTQDLEASTPTKIYGNSESVLHTTAVEELGGLLRGVGFPAEDFEAP
jgi:hypothetical protein